MCWGWEGTKVHALGCLCSSGMNISCFVKLFMAACGSLFLPSLSLSLSISLSVLSILLKLVLFFFNEGMEENVHSNILALIVSQFTVTYQPHRITKRFNQYYKTVIFYDEQIVDCIILSSIKRWKLADSWEYLQIRRKTWRCTMTWKSLCVCECAWIRGSTE